MCGLRLARALGRYEKSSVAELAESYWRTVHVRDSEKYPLSFFLVTAGQKRKTDKVARSVRRSRGSQRGGGGSAKAKRVTAPDSQLQFDFSFVP